MTDQTQDPMLLVKRLEKIGAYRDYLNLLNDFAVTLPEHQKNELMLKVGKIADVLAWEIEQLREWHRNNTLIH
jgi:hypothetical protein